MCGIAGLFHFHQKVTPEELDRFTDSLTHRGPDGRGTYLDGPLGLGHRRLAILDPTEAGACPMHYQTPDSRQFWITYNGEVYNFLELRRELQALGYRFHSETDTEVIVAAYAAWGQEFQLRLNGMWALAIWEPARSELFLSRDRFGIKPLYFSYDDRRFCFASELKAFPSLTGFAARLDASAVSQFLASPNAFDGVSIDTGLAGVKRLPPGHCLVVSADGRLASRRWWDTMAHVPEIPPGEKQQVERFRDLFLDAVRIRMRSDVPLGTCLSGGIDSSAVASAMAHLHRLGSGLERCPDDWQRTFVATFPGTAVDEGPFAEEVIRHVGGKPHYWIHDSQAAVSGIIDSIWALDDLSSAPAVPVWSIYREMRRNSVVVSLDGHGGDELLGGYTFYLDVPLGELNQALFNDFHATHMPAILRNYDRCSMAHGIEVRMPLMDWRLVTYSFGLDARMKIGGGFTKRILRESMAGIMPETIRLRRAKIGFASPLLEWFNGPLAPLIFRLTAHPLWLGSPFWDGPALAGHVREKTAGRAWQQADWDEAMRLWTFLSLTIWQMLYLEGGADELRGLC